MTKRSLEKLTGKKLEIDHIFSCEIEPFKQVRASLLSSLTFFLPLKLILMGYRHILKGTSLLLSSFVT